MGWWVLALAVLVGHFGLNLACYNRINAQPLPRPWIKAIEVVLLIECLIVGLLLVVVLARYLTSGASLSLSTLPTGLVAYGGGCLLALVYFGGPWLWYRPLFRVEWLRVAKRVEISDVADQLRSLPAGSARCRLMARLPLNQIFQLAVEQKELPIQNLPDSLVGLKIAHISDIHLTGHVLPAFFQVVAEKVMRWQPDLVALTGDLVDKQRCIEWLPDCFGSITAPHGCYFILGNHDTRVSNPDEVREAMQRLGWVNLGGISVDVMIKETLCEIVGTEVPWFGTPPPIDPNRDVFRLVLSHSPDQIRWARRQRAHLMLAGHTHGGQGRLPLVGPLLSPSCFGSRYASGEFEVPPTVLHVTRGLSGTHLMRINCPPEVSLLTLVHASRS